MDKKFFFTSFVIICSLFSCGEISNIDKDLTTKGDDVFNGLKNRPQVFRFSLDSSISFVGEKGTLIKLNEGCLLNIEGKAVKDSLILELTEFYSLSEIIFSKLSSQTSDNLLETSGMVLVSIRSKSGDEIKVNKKMGFEVGIVVNGDFSNDMRLYGGNMRADESVIWNDVIADLNDITSKKNDTIYSEDGGYMISVDEEQRMELDYYIYSSHEFGWLNADKEIEYSGNSKGNLNIKSDVTHNVSYSLIFTKLNAVSIPIEKEKDISKFYNLPIGEQATLIGLYKDGNQYYMCNEKIVVQDGMIIDPIFRKVTVENLKQEIDEIEWNN
ncbi:MAG: hypothetical protein KDD41_03980 [Flavobacteriales bacterium]|nr:hypothetical protein [Flavobacteriales bacterium]